MAIQRKTAAALPSQGPDPGAYGRTDASSGGSFSRNQAIAVRGPGPVTRQFVGASPSRAGQPAK